VENTEDELMTGFGLVFFSGMSVSPIAAAIGCDFGVRKLGLLEQLGLLFEILRVRRWFFYRYVDHDLGFSTLDLDFFLGLEFFGFLAVFLLIVHNLEHLVEEARICI
jgi:hypothetical protein